MTSLMLSVRTPPVRLLTRVEAAAYCRISPKHFSVAGAVIRLKVLRTAAALGLVFGLAWPALALDTPSPSPTLTTQPASRFTRSEPGVREAYIVSFGLFGGDSVFESEARGAAQILSERLPKAQSLVSFNTKRGGRATPPRLLATLKAAGAAMDPEEDVLVLALTSHGTRHGLAVMAGRRSGVISPRKLRTMLDASGARYRIVIISACYSGVFIPVLANPSTLVITAAAADRPSFGCEDGATWTYFGDAFYNQALRRHGSLNAAFAEAKRLVTDRERRESFEPSEPQIAGGALVLRLLTDGH
jgi:Peptidase C13 family